MKNLIAVLAIGILALCGQVWAGDYCGANGRTSLISWEAECSGDGRVIGIDYYTRYASNEELAHETHRKLLKIWGVREVYNFLDSSMFPAHVAVYINKGFCWRDIHCEVMDILTKHTRRARNGEESGVTGCLPYGWR